MAGSIPFWTGGKSTVTILFRNKKLLYDVKSWRIKREGTEAADGVCGEDRDRPQFVIGLFSLQLEGFQQKLDALEQMLLEQADIDASTLPKESAVVIKITPNDGSKKVVQCSEYTVDGWEIGASGRTDRNNMTLPGRFRYLKFGKAA